MADDLADPGPLVARGELPVGRADLPDGQPAAARAAAPRAREAAAARPLGHDPGPELHLRPPQPRDHGARHGDALHHRPRPRRPRRGGRGVPRGHLLRGLPRHRPRTSAACAGCSPSSPSRAASPATSRRRRRGRSTRAASSATRSRTRTAPRSTTPTSWSRRWSATARRRPGRWRPAGTARSSSTRVATARCCRSCTSTATRSPTRRCWRGSPRTSCSR